MPLHTPLVTTAPVIRSTHCICSLSFICTSLRFFPRVAQGKQILRDGIGRASEVEEEVPASDVEAARVWLQNPDAMLTASPLLTDLNKCVYTVCLRGAKAGVRTW